MVSVLYVDDEIGLLEIAKLFLEQEDGFRVSTAASAKEALTLLATGVPDAIISDYMMPGMDGIAFLKAVRERYGDLPFILFTGRGREEIVIEAINNGADSYIQKGGDPATQFAELKHKVRQALRRRQAELERARSEEKFSKLFLANPSLEAITDFATGRLIDVNEAWIHTTGYAREDVIGKTTREIDLFVEYADRERMAHALVHEGIVQHFETRIRTKSGDIRTLDFTGQRIRVGDNDMLFSQAVDITERKLAEEALFSSRQMLQAVLDNIPQRVFWKDRNLTFLGCNLPLARDVGFQNPSQIIGKTDYDHASHALADQFRADDLRVMESGIPRINFEEPQIRPDGSRAWLRTSKIPLRNLEGEIIGILGTYEDITNTKRTEEALRESEEMFRLTLMNANDGIMVNELTDRGPGKFIEVNDMACRILGMTREELGGTKLIDLDTPEMKKRAKGIITEIVNKRHAVFQTDYMTKDGRAKYLDINVSVFDLKGRPTMLSVVRDITEQKQAQDAVRESEERFRSIVETSPNMIWEVDLEGRFRYMSPAVTRIMGYLPEEIIGKPVTDLVPEDKRDFAREKLGQMVSSEGSLQAVEIPARHRDGRDLVLEIRPAPLTGADSSLKGLRGVAIDITDRRRVEEALCRNRQDLAEAMDIAGLVNWEYDVATGMFTFDDRFYALYGTTAEREGGIRMSSEAYAQEFIHPDDRAIVATKIRKTLQATDPDYLSQVEHRIIRRDGAVRHIIVRIRITKDAEGRTIRTHGANQDITDQKTAEEALSRANRQLSLLGSITRHDIVNKITVILGYLRIAAMKNPEPALAELLKKIESSTCMIQDLIEFTRQYQEIGTQTPQWINLATAMPRSCLPATISLHADVEGISVYTDPMLHKVFFNLLDNAIRHGERVTEIRVAVRAEGKNRVIIWEDNGIGIEQSEKERVFEHGFGKHTGLGMFLSREILSLTGMTIRETGTPGRGARFEITVPEGMWQKTGGT